MKYVLTSIVLPLLLCVFTTASVLFGQTPPVKSGSKFPNLLVENDHLAMTWFEVNGADKRLLFSELNKEQWSSPVTIASSGNFFLNWADFPSLYSLGGDTLAVHYLEKSGRGTYDYNVKVSFSYNHGKTWTGC